MRIRIFILLSSVVLTSCVTTKGTLPAVSEKKTECKTAYLAVFARSDFLQQINLSADPDLQNKLQYEIQNMGCEKMTFISLIPNTESHLEFSGSTERRKTDLQDGVDTIKIDQPEEGTSEEKLESFIREFASRLDKPLILAYRHNYFRGYHPGRLNVGTVVYLALHAASLGLIPYVEYDHVAVEIERRDQKQMPQTKQYIKNHMRRMSWSPYFLREDVRSGNHPVTIDGFHNEIVKAAAREAIEASTKLNSTP